MECTENTFFLPVQPVFFHPSAVAGRLSLVGGGEKTQQMTN